MAKLLDLLEKSSRSVPSPIGFGATHQKEKVAPILLLGISEFGDKVAATKIADAGLHGAVFTSNVESKKTAIDSTVKLVKELAWGVWRDLPSTLPMEGSDFEIFTSDATPIAVLSGEDRMMVMQVEPELEDGLMRTLEDLPIDAFLISLLDAPTLTVRELMRIARVRGATSKYVMVMLGDLPNKDEQVVLRDLGISALLINMAGHSVATLKECVAELTDLPQTSPQKRSEKIAATLPSVRVGLRPDRRDDDDDDDDDDSDLG